MDTHQYRGKGRRRKTKRGGFSQASTRRPITLYDQHGRQWSGQVSNKSGMPVGQVTPDFSAPWYPDVQYLRVNPDNQAELWIDYASLVARRRGRLNSYHKIAREYCREKKLPAPDKGDYNETITRAIGAPPKPIQPAIAAMQGKNKWILGLSDKVDPRLERFVTRIQAVEVDEEFDFSDPETSFEDAKRNTQQMIRGLAKPKPVAEEDVDDIEDLKDIQLGEGEEDTFLDELDDEHDQAGIGGHVVPPAKAERVQRQAPRRPGTKVAKKGKTGAKKFGNLSAMKRAQRGNRPTLASGAAPVISG